MGGFLIARSPYQLVRVRVMVMVILMSSMCTLVFLSASRILKMGWDGTPLCHPLTHSPTALKNSSCSCVCEREREIGGG